MELPTAKVSTNDALTLTAHRLAMIGRAPRKRRQVCCIVTQNETLMVYMDFREWIGQWKKKLKGKQDRCNCSPGLARVYNFLLTFVSCAKMGLRSLLCLKCLVVAGCHWHFNAKSVSHMDWNSLIAFGCLKKFHCNQGFVVLGPLILFDVVLHCTVSGHQNSVQKFLSWISCF